jgi:hypothetical protein
MVIMSAYDMIHSGKPSSQMQGFPDMVDWSKLSLTPRERRYAQAAAFSGL